MMRRIQKLALTFLAAGVIGGCVSMPLCAEAAEIAIPEDAIASGVIDEDYGQITWVIDRDGKLTVTGTGDTADPDNAGDDRQPWYNYTDRIESAEINVKGMTNASRLFSGCSNLGSLDVSNFDTGRVTDMGFMFNGCGSLESPDVGNFDTSQVTDMSGMFFSVKVLPVWM